MCLIELGRGLRPGGVVDLVKVWPSDRGRLLVGMGPPRGQQQRKQQHHRQRQPHRPAQCPAAHGRLSAALPSCGGRPCRKGAAHTLTHTQHSPGQESS